MGKVAANDYQCLRNGTRGYRVPSDPDSIPTIRETRFKCHAGIYIASVIALKTNCPPTNLKTQVCQTAVPTFFTANAAKTLLKVNVKINLLNV